MAINNSRSLYIYIYSISITCPKQGVVSTLRWLHLSPFFIGSYQVDRKTTSSVAPIFELNVWVNFLNTMRHIIWQSHKHKALRIGDEMDCGWMFSPSLAAHLKCKLQMVDPGTSSARSQGSQKIEQINRYTAHHGAWPLIAKDSPMVRFDAHLCYSHNIPMNGKFKR